MEGHRVLVVVAQTPVLVVADLVRGLLGGIMAAVLPVVMLALKPAALWAAQGLAAQLFLNGK
jgi:hypothetical protein